MDHQVLAENIALLRTLNPEPTRPHENTPSFSVVGPDNEHGRQLSFKQEQQVVDTLAFVCATSEDSTSIIAMCFEEHPNDDSSTIVIAINKGDLISVRDALMGVTSILQRVAANGLGTVFHVIDLKLIKWVDGNENDVLDSIVSINLERILSRLRSRHAIRSRRNEGKPAIASRLEEAVNVAILLGRNDLISDAHVPKLRSQCQQLSKTFMAIESKNKYQISTKENRELISNFTRGALEIGDQHNLEALLNAIPPSENFSPGTGSTLRESLGKIGRYCSASLYLVAAARKFAIFKKIRIQCVSMFQESGVLLRPIESTVKRALTRVLDDIAPERITKRLRKFERATKFASGKAETDYQQNLTSASQQAKVHAEVQLIYYYAQKKSSLQPRVISASKCACFLCDLFIKLHGGFHVARSHGVLYSSWTVPNSNKMSLSEDQMHKFDMILKKLNHSLQHEIRKALEVQGLKRLHPNESVFVQYTWTPSVRSLDVASIQSRPFATHSEPAAATMIGCREPTEPVPEISIPTAEIVPSGSSSPRQTPSTSKRADAVHYAPTSLLGQNLPTPEASSTKAHSITHELLPDSTFSFIVDSVGSLLVTTPRLELIFTLEAPSDSQGIHCQGEVSIGRRGRLSAQSNCGDPTTLEIDSLHAGMEKKFEKEEGEETIRFNLLCSSDERVGFCCKWMEEDGASGYR
ncbi:MAG: hypothetical protein M1814_005991 [Vezdaea aestivalis]|nr:MAG: hypothetical protein M1814_005991 [Vezdaea aestivalis]